MADDKNLDKLIDLSYEKFVEGLGDVANDPKIQAILNSGSREKISFSNGTVPINKLTPTQQEIVIEKSIKYEFNGSDMVAINDTVKGRPVECGGLPIITLNGRYVLDGHHRFCGVYCLNPNAKAAIYDMKLNLPPIEALKVVQLAIASVAKSVPYSTPEGTNLFDTDEKQLKKFIVQHLVKEVVEAMGYDDVEECAEYFLGNLELLKAHNRPVKGAPSRIYMPQTGKAPGSLEKLKHGKVKTTKPFISGNVFEDFLQGRI